MKPFGVGGILQPDGSGSDLPRYGEYTNTAWGHIKLTFERKGVARYWKAVEKAQPEIVSFHPDGGPPRDILDMHTHADGDLFIMSREEILALRG